MLPPVTSLQHNIVIRISVSCAPTAVNSSSGGASASSAVSLATSQTRGLFSHTPLTASFSEDFSYSDIFIQVCPPLSFSILVPYFLTPLSSIPLSLSLLSVPSSTSYAFYKCCNDHNMKGF